MFYSESELLTAQLTLYPVMTVLEEGILTRWSSKQSVALPHSATASPLLRPRMQTSHSSLPSLVLSSPTGTRRRFMEPQDIRRVILRTVIALGVLGVAIAIPAFDQVIGLLGSLFSTTASLLFPILCYVSLMRHFEEPTEEENFFGVFMAAKGISFTEKLVLGMIIDCNLYYY
jgi:hypothetical protein